MEYIGQKINRLTILNYAGRDKHYHKLVEVQCDCEDKTIFITRLRNVLDNKTPSCGCLKKENNIKNFKKYNTYDLTGDYGIGYTFKGEEFYFDLEDYDKIKDICWLKNSYGYILGNHKGRLITMHNLIMDRLWIDHIYHNLNDNRKENLRVVTQQQNQFNRRGCGKMSKFGLKGICWNTLHSQWVGQLKKDKKQIYRKQYNSVVEAIQFQIEVEKIYFGEHRYAWENDIKWDELLEYEKELKNNA